MATSPLYDGNIGGRRDRITERGHGTRALGPGDSSDTGSDLVGAHGLGDDIPDELEESANAEPAPAGTDIGRDVHDDADIQPDRIETIRPDDEDEPR